jgi:RHS repeat-associated protein
VHAYDADGRRIRTTGPPVKWNYTGVTTLQWSAAGGLPVLLAESRPWAAYGGADVTYFVYGPDHVPVAQVNPDGSVYALHRDQLGSITVVTNSAGAPVAGRRWDPYGTLVASVGAPSWPVPFGWAGEYRDEAGLVNLRARVYDPTTGTFLQRDPIAPTTREPYGYGGGNPLNATDPSGLYCITGVAGYDASGGEICNGADEARDNLNPDKNYFAQVWDHQLDKDWGTAAAGSFNVVYGGTRFLTGIAALQASGACGMFGPEMMVVCAGASAYMIVTGGARVYRGVNQLRDYDNNPYASGDGCSVGSNAGRFVRGIAPKPAGSIWDLLGGLP